MLNNSQSNILMLLRLLYTLRTICFLSFKINQLSSEAATHRGVPRNRCCENMQQINRRTHIPKSDFNKVGLQLYWNDTSAWVFSSKFAAYFQNTFSKERLWTATSVSFSFNGTFVSILFERRNTNCLFFLTLFLCKRVFQIRNN